MNYQKEAWEDAKALKENNEYVNHITQYLNDDIGICISKNATMAHTSQILLMMNKYANLMMITRYTDLDYHEFWFRPEGE